LREHLVDAFEEQLACEPEPDVNVEFELIDVFVSELSVRVRGFFATGETGGDEIRELTQDSLSLSSVADVLLMINDVLGGLIGGDLSDAVVSENDDDDNFLLLLL
jgi:hypothetical protein